MHNNKHIVIWVKCGDYINNLVHIKTVFNYWYSRLFSFMFYIYATSCCDIYIQKVRWYDNTTSEETNRLFFMCHLLPQSLAAFNVLQSCIIFMICINLNLNLNLNRSLLCYVVLCCVLCCVCYVVLCYVVLCYVVLCCVKSS